MTKSEAFIIWLDGFLSIPYLSELKESDEHYVEFNIIRSKLKEALSYELNC